MKKLTQLLLSVIVLFILLISCNNYIPQTPYSYLDGTWHGLFEGYWNGMNNNYAFWSIDSPSNEWDLKYDEYSAKFKALGKIYKPNATPEQLASVSQMAAKLFMDMNKDLTDGHFALIMKFPNIKKTLFQPSEYQKAKKSSKYTDDATLFKAIFEYYNDEKNNDLSNYLPEDLKNEKTLTILEKTFGFKIDTETNEEDKKIRECSNSLLDALSSTNYTQSTKDTTKLDFTFKEWMIYNEEGNNSLMCLLGLTNENIVYIAFDGFNFYPFLEDANVIALVDQFRKYKQDPTTKGMIVDLRGNTGGYNVDRDILFSDLVDDKKQFAWYRSKTGDNRLDYTPYLPVYLYQYVDPEGKPFTASPVANKPIAVLTNSASLSNSEVTTLLLKTFSKGVSIGGTTSGGFGCLNGTIDVSNSGEFSIDNYLTVYTPNQQIVALDKTSYEGIGITPDYPVEFKLADFNNGTDARLNEAFKYVNGNK